MIIETNEQEIRVLITLIDAGVRQNGIRGAADAVMWVMKLEAVLQKEKDGSKLQTGP